MARPPAVARVLERVTATVREHGLVLPGQTVLVGVSGGPDSVCLLHSLHALGRLLRVRLEVVHVDHRLREDSAADAAYVRRQCDRLRVPFHLRIADGGPGRGESVEAWGRAQRHRAFDEVRRESGAGRVALAHTMDDQAETVLLAALTGRGLEAVSGMKPMAGPFVRPLLEVTRAEVEACCRALHLRPRMDPTNADPRFLRNALRLRGIPALERALRRPVRAPLAQTAALLRDDAEELARRALVAFDDVVEETPDGVDLRAMRLASLPRAVASRVVRLALLRCNAVAGREDVDAVLDLAAGRPGRRRDLSQGLNAARGAEYVGLSRTSPESRV
ncbi:MAG TPA: tRNA lysidine(34) synthetase TilS [Actinomycetota bacterium]|nr:tRNA lysidine(34) synthetase TilS [Actinomycetota bacterium]